MALGIGAKASLTLKEESAWGTFVTSPTARDVHARIITEEGIMKVDQAMVKAKHMAKYLRALWE